MKYLIVVAHPDDETLGAGASMWKWAHNGDTVDVCIMCTEAKARAFRPEDNELEDDTNVSNKFLGVNKIYEGTFPNIELQSRRVSLMLSSLIILQTRIMITCRRRWHVRRQSACSSVGRR